jgi:hypothetical protein
VKATRAVLAAAALLLAAPGCGPKEIKPAPPPLRPEAAPAPAPAPAARTDCDPVTIGDQKPAVKYRERSIEEGDNLANEGFAMLRAAEQRGVPEPERERLITSAVERFITALLADPYNVHATYNLAAAYARIDRFQCALDLLARLEALRRLTSQTAKVEAKLDRLLGRGRYGGNLDPDFNAMRDDERFRELVRRLQ